MAVGVAERESDSTCRVQEHADPRVRRTRRLLQDAFRTLIRERKFSDISVQDITEAADINRATFYAHYDDKSSLGVSVMRTDLHAAVVDVFKQKPAFTRENLVKFGTAVIEFIGDIHDGCPKAAADLHGALSTGILDEVYDVVYGWLGNNKTHLRLFPECSREAVATVIASSIYGAAFRWVRLSRREQSAEEVSRGIVAVLVR